MVLYETSEKKGKKRTSGFCFGWCGGKTHWIDSM